MIVQITFLVAWLTLGVCTFSIWLSVWNYRTDLVMRYPAHYDSLKRVGCSNSQHPVCLEINFFNQTKLHYLTRMVLCGPLAWVWVWQANKRLRSGIYFILNREVLGMNEYTKF